MKTRRKLPGCRVAVEIQRSTLLALVAGQRQDGQGECVRWLEMDWLCDADSLASDSGLRELTAALTSLVTREKLAGADVHVLLSSDFCVTRVLAGDNERLQPEVRNLRERSHQYLLLGTGPKAVAESSLATDARHSLTWLTIVNQQILDHVIHSFEHAGLNVRLAEHSLMALCRALGRLEHDAVRPVIIIDLNERGVDLGVSYQGKLLFDYRPGGVDCKEHLAQIVSRHLQRIQRYCHRQFRVAQGGISEVFVNGPRAEVEFVRRQFEGLPLQARVLDPTGLCAEGEAEPTEPLDPRAGAALGSLLVQERQLEQPAGERGLPDLMDVFRHSRRVPLVPALLRAAWPVAATLLLAVGLALLGFFEQSRLARIDRTLAALHTDLDQVHSLQLETEAATRKVRALTQLTTAVNNAPYHHLISAVGQSLPPGVWLDVLTLQQDGSLVLQGPGHSEDLIFRFVEELKKLPLLADVRLEGQQPVQLSSGPAVRFDIKGRYVPRPDFSDRTARND